MDEKGRDGRVLCRILEIVVGKYRSSIFDCVVGVEVYIFCFGKDMSLEVVIDV